MNARRMMTVLSLLVLSAFVWAQDEGDTFEFSGDRTSIVLAEGREQTVLSGNATVTSDEVTLRADEIELSGDDFRYADTRGSVRVVDAGRDLTIEAESLLFDRDSEDSRAEGEVVVEDGANDLIVKGGYLETREGGDLIIMQSGVRVLQDDLTARAQFLRYRRESEVLELSGFPVVYWKGDEYRATRIVLNLDTEEIELQGRVEGEVVIDEEPDEPVEADVIESPAADGERQIDETITGPADESEREEFTGATSTDDNGASDVEAR